MRLIDESTALPFFSTIKLGLSIVLYSETGNFIALIKMQINIQTAARVSVSFNMALHLRTNHYFITRTQNEMPHVSSCCMSAGEINLYWTIAGVGVWTWRVKLHLVSFIVCGGARRQTDFSFSLTLLFAVNCLHHFQNDFPGENVPYA